MYGGDDLITDTSSSSSSVSSQPQSTMTPEALKLMIEQDKQNRIKNTQLGIDQLCQINNTKVIPYVVVDKEQGITVSYRVVVN
jgi:hypothetical protein